MIKQKYGHFRNREFHDSQAKLDDLRKERGR